MPRPMSKYKIKPIIGSKLTTKSHDQVAAVDFLSLKIMTKDNITLRKKSASSKSAIKLKIISPNPPVYFLYYIKKSGIKPLLLFSFIFILLFSMHQIIGLKQLRQSR